MNRVFVSLDRALCIYKVQNGQTKNTGTKGVVFYSWHLMAIIGSTNT